MYCNPISIYTASFTLKHPSQLLHVRIQRSEGLISLVKVTELVAEVTNSKTIFSHHILSLLVRGKGEERKDREEIVSSTDAS